MVVKMEPEKTLLRQNFQQKNSFEDVKKNVKQIFVTIFFAPLHLFVPPCLALRRIIKV